MNEHKPQKLEARYANAFRVGQNDSEFLFEFGQYDDAYDTERFHTRLVTSPRYAKAILMTLQSAIDEHEAVHGSLSDDCLEDEHD